MKKGVYLLPNGLTLCGMFFGFFSIIHSFRAYSETPVIAMTHYVTAAEAILVAAIFDVLDGWVARLTSTTSKFGVQLDSLSDLVAFGVAPAVLYYSWALKDFKRLGWAAAFLLVACGALRLARFNVQMGTSESKSFTGMPIPSGAGIIATTVMFYTEHFERLPERNYLFPALAFLVAFLMVSTIRYHGAKEMNLKERKPFWYLVAFVSVVSAILYDPPRVLFLLGMIYMLSGIMEYVYLHFFRTRQEAKST